MEDKKIKLKLQGLTNSQIQSGAYALVLSEDGHRRIPIIIGMFEAQSIAIALESINPPRPLTHDLFVAYNHATGYRMQEVFIHKFEDGVFYSEIVITNGKDTIRIDSRTSDAIAIAMRSDCDIYTTETIMTQCGIVLDEADSLIESNNDDIPEEFTTEDLQDVSKLMKQLSRLNVKEIKERMRKAVDSESYELAKVYRDELLKRKEGTA